MKPRLGRYSPRSPSRCHWLSQAQHRPKTSNFASHRAPNGYTYVNLSRTFVPEVDEARGGRTKPRSKS